MKILRETNAESTLVIETLFKLLGFQCKVQQLSSRFERDKPLLILEVLPVKIIFGLSHEDRSLCEYLFKKVVDLYNSSFEIKVTKPFLSVQRSSALIFENYHEVSLSNGEKLFCLSASNVDEYVDIVRYIQETNKRKLRFISMKFDLILSLNSGMSAISKDSNPNSLSSSDLETRLAEILRLSSVTKKQSDQVSKSSDGGGLFELVGDDGVIKLTQVIEDQDDLSEKMKGSRGYEQRVHEQQNVPVCIRLGRIELSLDQVLSLRRGDRLEIDLREDLYPTVAIAGADLVIGNFQGMQAPLIFEVLENRILEELE